MRVALRATDGGFIADDDAVGFSFGAVDDTDAEHYLNLQRQPEDWPADDDWGIYLEYDDQSAGTYACVRACRVSREKLSIDLSKPLHASLEFVTGFDLDLSGIPNDAYATLAAGLPRAFRDVAELLAIE